MQLGQWREQLSREGVETVGIIATNAERARLYLRLRPTKLPLAADPDCNTHHAYGIGNVDYAVPEVLDEVQKPQYNPAGELAKPVSWPEAFPAYDKLDGFTYTKTDEEDVARHQRSQMTGQALVDRDGVIRWLNTEMDHGAQALGGFPAVEELLDLARSL